MEFNQNFNASESSGPRGGTAWQSGSHYDAGQTQMDYGNQSSSYPYPSSNTSTSSSQGQQDDDGSNRKNLIINYLPQHLSDRDLYDLFIPYGNIENARVMKDKKTNYSYGYGFVNYTEESSATEAINAMNGKRVDHKFLKVSLARPSGEEIKDTNLYVCNLRRDITEDDLIRMFSPFGEIVQQNILQDKYTGLPRGVAFVRFSKRAEANAAIDAMNNFIPDGSTEALRVKLAENHGKQKSAYLSGFQDGFSQYGPRRF